MWALTWELAGITGLDPGPLTFGELQHAAKAKLDFDWGQTASLMTIIANCHRGKHSRPFKTEDFYRPQLRQKHRSKLTSAKLRAMKPLFKKQG